MHFPAQGPVHQRQTRGPLPLHPMFPVGNSGGFIWYVNFLKTITSHFTEALFKFLWFIKIKQHLKFEWGSEFVQILPRKVTQQQF
jgi:hypothetical protein